MAVHAFNPNTQEAEEGRTNSELQSKFQESQDYTEKPCLAKEEEEERMNWNNLKL